MSSPASAPAGGADGEQGQQQQQLLRTQTTSGQQEQKDQLPGKLVLDGVSGSFQSGSCVAVMGPSGSGKTTFMSALTGKANEYGEITGDVYVNGVHDGLNKLGATEVGFV